MGRPTPAHYDDLFLNKVKSVCYHVLDQLNADNEIEQAFDLCPSISRRNRVISSFLRNTDGLQQTSPTLSSNPTANSSRLAPLAIRDDDSESVSSLSAQRRRQARGIQFVTDPNDSPDELEPLTASTTQGLSSDPPPFPAVPLPDYTFEQFADHFDPEDKFLKRIFEIIIKETARQALKRKQGTIRDAASENERNIPFSSLPSHRRLPVDTGARSDFSTNFARRMRHIFNNEEGPSNAQPASGADYTDFSRRMRLLFSRDEEALTASTRGQPSSSNADPSIRVVQNTSGNADGSPAVLFTRTLQPLSSRRDNDDSQDSMLDSLLRSQGSSDRSVLPATTPFRTRTLRRRFQQNQADAAAPYSVTPSAGTLRNASDGDLSPQAISERLAIASRRNADAARTIDQTNRLARTTQRGHTGDLATEEGGAFQATLVRHSIESLRADLMRLHANYAVPPSRPLISTDLTSVHTCVLGCIELFEDMLRRLSTSTRNVNHAPHALRMGRDHLLIDSMRRQAREQEQPEPSSDDLSAAEMLAHRHLFATIEEAHWMRPDIPPPEPASITAWRRRLACWYFVECDDRQCANPILTRQGAEDPYPRWTPHSELAYPVDVDNFDADLPEGPRPDPIAEPRQAWMLVRQQFGFLFADLSQDENIRAALGSPAVAAALTNLRTVQANNSLDSASVQPATSTNVDAIDTAVNAGNEAATSDADVSLTRTVSLSRRNAIRGTAAGSDSASVRSARSTASRRENRPHSEGLAPPTAEDQSDTVMSTGGQSSLAPRPSAGRRRSSFTFVTTPAAVLRSGERSQSRGARRHSQSGSSSDAAGNDSDAEELVDLDLHLGLAGAEGFDFDLQQFLRNVSDPSQRRQGTDGLERYERLMDSTLFDDDAEIQVYVSGSGASTPAEARQATFEAYAQRARLLERRRRMPLQTSQDQTDSLNVDESERPRRRPSQTSLRNDTSNVTDTTEPNSLPFPRGAEH